jgi:hypothetical protein
MKETIDIWNWRTGVSRQSLSKFTGGEAFAWTPDGSRFVAVSKEDNDGYGLLMVWDPDNGERLLEQGTQSFAEPGNSLSCIPGTSKLFSWRGHGVQYWDGTPESVGNE